MSKRLAGRFGYPKDNPFSVTMHPEKLDQPLRWQKPRSVFVVSMGDLFHGLVPFRYIAAVYGVMAAAKHHTFQVLTKRPERALDFYRWIMNLSELPEVVIGREAIFYDVPRKYFGDTPDWSWPPKNVWIGTTVEAQHLAARRLPDLLQIPAPVRFVSCEPLLEQIDLKAWLEVDLNQDEYKDRPYYATKPRLDWVICGGESGQKARPMHIEWARSLRDQCIKFGVPFWFKQWGEWMPLNGLDLDEQKRIVLTEERDTIDWESNRQSFYSVRVTETVNLTDDLNVWSARVGKKAAGSTLDGKEWKQKPEVSDGL
jgi:protein gp37